ncbi:hypothetical protein DFR87_11815 [Metallosphaera hakonensis JCM 8857 = DSM 7519]|uniref:HEAT repeat domain-containing protein n=1 Tax=Metallosphaera hakonensis JCM 8857 = DSM 7519 TaxID=1293036 RepID=A0A2U9IW30_9CREN|nr:hypothetical protein DFR87_11815 [Metallosphaera hakonensis JCM 8857 = DSM 7519]
MVEVKLYRLKSLDPRLRQLEWSNLEREIDANPKKFMRYRLYLRSLLWSRVQGIREEAWRHLHVYKKLNASGIERAFESRSDRIKITAWEHAKEAIDMDLVSREEMVKLSQHFWRLLRSYYPTVRKKAWKVFPTLVQLNIIRKKDIPRFMQFLKYAKPGVRVMAWNAVKFLLDSQIITKEDLTQYLPYLVELTNRDSVVARRAKNILVNLN